MPGGARVLTRARLLAAGVAALAAAVLPGCDGNGGGDSVAGPSTSGSSTPGPSAAGYEAAFHGLCRARASAGTDVNAARSTFYDRSHDPLHSLARDLQPIDRVLAARLLEAKEAVESDLRADRPPPSLGPDLDRLVEVTGQALSRLARPVPRCP